MKYVLKKHIVFLVLYFVITGCSKTVPSDPTFTLIDSTNLPPSDTEVIIEGLSPCTTSTDATLRLNSKEPTTVIVHGCKSSAARFRSLAQVFAFHGQQTFCFNYDDRDSLMESSARLIDALHSLSKAVRNQEITVIGHSQGGLVSRKALVGERDEIFSADHTSVRLVTVSTPYAGISAANHCASTTVRFLTLGLAVPICKLISGDKWYEITQPSTFIQRPGKLLDQVSSHLKIVTDETNSCRRYEKDICVEDDYVFSLNEQYFEPIDKAENVNNIEIQAGHAEIVGDYNVKPEKLIKLLQGLGIMRPTLPEQEKRLLSLLTQLYSSAP